MPRFGLQKKAVRLSSSKEGIFSFLCFADVVGVALLSIANAYRVYCFFLELVMKKRYVLKADFPNFQMRK